MRSLRSVLKRPKGRATTPTLITLTTDFGTKDPFVACMKGVILGINPRARIVDITHEIPSYDLEEAAFLINSFYNDFPSETIHLVVVDPGVGSPRRPLLVTTHYGWFLAPDNGILSYVFQREKTEVREITQERYFRPSPGATFHGRDLFAPVAGWLSRGKKPEEFGPLYLQPITLPLKEPRYTHPNKIRGEILHVDKFGNLISNITWAYLQQGGWEEKLGRIQVRLRGSNIGGLRRFYAEIKEGEIGCLVNSFGYVEVYCYRGDAQRFLRAGKGAEVVLLLK
jgi:S-adenosylmethionine hydrolase